MNFLRILAIVLGVSVACVVGLIVYVSIWDAEELELWSGFEAMSQPSSEKRPFEHFELICVIFDTSELHGEGKRFGRDLYRGCGYTDSNYAVIVTVKYGEISCKQTNRFVFVRAEGSPACMQSDNLSVRKRIYTGGSWPRGWGASAHGQPYFEIGQKLP